MPDRVPDSPAPGWRIQLEIGPLVTAFVELGELTGTPTPTIDVVNALVSQLNARLTAP